MITRHFLTIPAGTKGQARRVHYRRCGSGPVLLMVHQSPRSSQEYERLMRDWGRYFTCIAPDSPGFGQSAALDGEPDVADFATGLLEFLDVLGVTHCHAYGFHSGAIILAHAIKQQPMRFTALALGGYASWTDAEMAQFGDRYAPPFIPDDYGEHLLWAWNRVLEQSWFFPWFDVRNETRMSVAHADLPRVHAAVMDLLEAGDAYRHGYNAALRAAPWTPGVDASTSPVLISAYDGDPLQLHMERLGPMPANWRTNKAGTPSAHEADCLSFLLVRPCPACPPLAEDAHEGFVVADGALVHWRGTRGSDTVLLHAPGAELTAPSPGALAIDVPGHGLSEAVSDIAQHIAAAKAILGAATVVCPQVPAGEPNQLYPSLEPQRFGEHLLRAWGVARAQAMYRPWYATDAAHAIAFDQAVIQPNAIATRTRALLRAGPAARQWHDALVKARP